MIGMAKLTSADIAYVKGKGFLINRGTELFSGRVVAAGTVFTAENFKALSEIASLYGSGKLICTSRQSIEIPGIPFEKIPDAIKYAEENGMSFGGTGNKVRPITACKGTTCVYGNFDTQALAKKIHEEYYKGWAGVKLPHKFKISVGGCPNRCIKPSLNDFGVEGHKVPDYDPDACRGCSTCAVEKACPMKAAKLVDGKMRIDKKRCLDCGVCTGKCPFKAVSHDAKTVFKIYVGGTWGKRTRMGTPLSRYVEEDEILPILEKSMLWFKENGYAKERFGLAIDRIGINKMEEALFGDDLLKRKQEILDCDISER